MKLNIPKAIPELANEPLHSLVKENYEEIASFHRDVWEKVARKLFVLIAIILELPEDYLANAHAYDELSDDHLRYMIYNVRTQEEWDLAQGYSKGGHTDFGSLTMLFSQHVAGLQIRTPEGQWKYVKPVEGGITCNAADTLTFLTKGIPPNASSSVSKDFMNRTHSSHRLRQIDRPPRCDTTSRPDQHPQTWPALLQ